MKYSEDLIEEVRTRNDIVNVIGEYVTLKRNGNRFVGLCPFHNEKTPSFSVNQRNQLYYCFGCHVGGNIYTFLKEHESMTFQEAFKYLADRAGVEVPEGDMSAEERKRLDESDRMKEIYREAAIFYYKALLSEAGRPGMDYLSKRGLGRDEIKKYGLGYSPSGSFLYRYLQNKGFSDRELKDSGLVRFNEKGGFDYFWSRVMFPIFDKNNHVIAFGGRRMDAGKERKYVNSEESLIFKKSKNLYGQNFAVKSKSDTLLLCEGYMDVIALQQAGFTNAVAALGTAFNLDHVVTIRRIFRGKEKIILTFDSDEAGIKAARKAIGTLREGGITDVRVLNMSPCKDPDEFIGKFGAEEYQKRIDTAKNSFLFEVDCRKREIDITNPDEKTKFHHTLAELLAPITDELMRNNYMEAVCRQEGIDFSVMKKLVAKAGEQLLRTQSRSYEEPARNKKNDPIDGTRKMEQLLLSWICSDVKIAEIVRPHLSPEDFSDDTGRMIAEKVFEQAGLGKVDPSRIIDAFVDSEENSARAAAYFNYNDKEPETSEDKSKALTEAVIKIKGASLQKKSANVGDIAELMKYTKMQNELKYLKLIVK